MRTTDHSVRSSHDGRTPVHRFPGPVDLSLNAHDDTDPDVPAAQTALSGSMATNGARPSGVPGRMTDVTDQTTADGLARVVDAPARVMPDELGGDRA